MRDWKADLQEAFIWLRQNRIQREGIYEIVTQIFCEPDILTFRTLATQLKVIYVIIYVDIQDA